MSEILELLGLDFLTIIWNFVRSAYEFFIALIRYAIEFTSWLYVLNPVIACALLLAIGFSIVFGVLRIIKLIPGL